MIKSVSISRLHEYESCPLRTKLKLIDKIPEPERPLRPGQTEHANDRGTRIHTECENFVRGLGEMPKEAHDFKTELERLQTLYKTGTVAMEGEWGFNAEWQSTEWLRAWLRMKLDAVVFLTPKHVAVIDHKTGARFGNEIKHGEQTQLYAAATCMKYPQIECVTTELWYFDQKELITSTFSREQAVRFVKPFDRRLKKMTEAKIFRATPNLISCKYCPYHPVRGTGDCTFGV